MIRNLIFETSSEAEFQKLIDRLEATNYQQRKNAKVPPNPRTILRILSKRATPRQREVMELLHMGMKGHEIADKMNVKEGTVRVTKNQLKQRAKFIRKNLSKKS